MCRNILYIIHQKSCNLIGIYYQTAIQPKIPCPSAAAIVDNIFKLLPFNDGYVIDIKFAFIITDKTAAVNVFFHEIISL